VSLYTSRIILSTLGETDFGIYNIVGGFIMLLSFVNSAMTTSTQRFLNYSIGKHNIEEEKKVFSMSLMTHVVIAVIIFLVLESLGLWFFNSKINIPENRINAAQWVFQFSTLSCCAQIIRVPYHASIIAHEKMSFYAYVSILEVLLKLGVVFSLLIVNSDKLISYSIFTFILIVVINLCYIFYSKKNFIACNYKFFWDKILFKKLISFSGWSMFGSAANVAANQGVNVVLNIFFGVTVNAAMGIANQVQSAIYSFVSNFQTAFNPQIVKSYAANDRAYFLSLVFRASKFSYYLLFILAFPVILCCQSILDIWLVNVPQYSVHFIQLFLVFLLIEAMSAPLWISVQATGEIKNYQLLMTSLSAINLPLVYVFFKSGYLPETALIIRILISFISHIIRLLYLKKHINFPALLYIKDVMLKCLLVSLVIIPIPLLIHFKFASLLGDIITIVTSVSISLFAFYFIGLQKVEKQLVIQNIYKIIKK